MNCCFIQCCCKCTINTIITAIVWNHFISQTHVLFKQALAASNTISIQHWIQQYLFLEQEHSSCGTHNILLFQKNASCSWWCYSCLKLLHSLGQGRRWRKKGEELSLSNVSLPRSGSSCPTYSLVHQILLSAKICLQRESYERES